MTNSSNFKSKSEYKSNFEHSNEVDDDDHGKIICWVEKAQ